MHTSSDRCFFFRTRTFDRKLYDGLPIIRTSIVDFEGHGTSIDGWVFSKDNESTRSLTNTSLLLMIEIIMMCAIFKCDSFKIHSPFHST